MEPLARVWHYLVCFWQYADLKTLAVLAGAIWAFYKLVQRGGLHPLLDLKVAGEYVRIADRGYVVCSMELTNAHLPMVLVDYCALRLSTKRDIGPDTEQGTSEMLWDDRDTFPVFRGHEKIWSDETVRDKLVVEVPEKADVFKLEFRIGRKYRWYQQIYRRLTGYSSWWAVAIVKQETTKPQ